jgi:hypothetical protein
MRQKSNMGMQSSFFFHINFMSLRLCCHKKHEKSGKKRSLTRAKALSGSPLPRFGGRRALGIRTTSTEKNGRVIGVSGSDGVSI